MKKQKISPTKSIPLLAQTDYMASFGNSTTLNSPKFSRKLNLEALSFENHNVGLLTSKKNLGGGFQTKTDSNVKMIENIYLKKHRIKKLKENKILESKIQQLKNFELGISSAKSSHKSRVSNRNIIIL